MKPKAILILGGSNDQLVMIDTAHDMGLVSVVVDGNSNAPGLKRSNYGKAIDFSDTDSVVAYCHILIEQGVNLSGVLTMGSDVPHLVAKIASEFSWVAPSHEVAEITTNKFLMKARFAENNIAMPQFALFENSDEISSTWADWKCKSIIIKPVDAAGSRGVSICNNEQDIAHLYLHAKQNSKSGQVIVEEYIEGEQISTESIIYNGKCYHPGFADRVYDDTRHFYPYIMENGGWQPSYIQGKKYNEICQLIEQVVLSLKLDRGVIKGDIVYSNKYKKAMVIEVASRLSGGDFSASLVPLAHDINYIKTAIQIAVNDEVDIKELTPKTNKVVANRYFFLPKGRLTEICVPDKIKRLPELKKLEFNYNVDDFIPKIENHGQRVGVFVIQGDSYKEVQDIIDIVYERITFIVDGNESTGHPKDYLHK